MEETEEGLALAAAAREKIKSNKRQLDGQVRGVSRDDLGCMHGTCCLPLSMRCSEINHRILIA